MKKLSFFSIPRNKTRKETIEVIKKCSHCKWVEIC